MMKDDKKQRIKWRKLRKNNMQEQREKKHFFRMTLFAKEMKIQCIICATEKVSLNNPEIDEYIMLICH